MDSSSEKQTRGMLATTLALVVLMTVGIVVACHGSLLPLATDSHEVVVIDKQLLRIAGRMAGGNYPDGLAYAPNEGKLFVSDQFGKVVKGEQ